MKEITYIKVGDYYFPDLKVSENITIGKYGRMKYRYLKEHHQGYLFGLQARNELSAYLQSIDFAANHMYDLLIEQYKNAYNITEELKENNQMMWIEQMNNINNLVEEIIKIELIFND